MAEKPMINVDKVKKRFNRENIIGDVSFTVEKGEIYALCGGNGAGKSTVMQMATGQLAPSEGSVFINGFSSKNNSREYKRLFAYMPDAMLFPKVLTGYEVLAFFGQLAGAETGRVEELLKKTGLWEDRNKKVKAYSKGMQQRLALAQALIPGADVLILDEPTNGLDPYWVKIFKDMLREEKQRGTAILLSSHILADVEEVADRVAFMKDGQILVEGTVEELSIQDGIRRRLEDVFFDSIVSS
ncbi:ABC transporter ATP-binding protein [Bacillus marinisedimentorum]|uniref:ABC transporter ATP-binding protein n=1 Tax=Bacillus marinisedimentorum TaxID=1821260 RepID=UPI001FE12EAF|nr:ABC transporter ATP-binding protein [Bacillus marinisedimentorum]